jgi:hypothetical protein
MSGLGKKVVPPPPPEKPEWSRCLEKSKRGFWRHRDPPHHLRYDPDAWEQAAATLEDAARHGLIPDIDEDNT